MHARKRHQRKPQPRSLANEPDARIESRNLRHSLQEQKQPPRGSPSYMHAKTGEAKFKSNQIKLKTGAPHARSGEGFELYAVVYWKEGILLLFSRFGEHRFTLLR